MERAPQGEVVQVQVEVEAEEEWVEALAEWAGALAEWAETVLGLAPVENVSVRVVDIGCHIRQAHPAII